MILMYIKKAFLRQELKYNKKKTGTGQYLSFNSSQGTLGLKSQRIFNWNENVSSRRIETTLDWLNILQRLILTLHNLN